MKVGKWLRVRASILQWHGLEREAMLASHHATLTEISRSLYVHFSEFIEQETVTSTPEITQEPYMKTIGIHYGHIGGDIMFSC